MGDTLLFSERLVHKKAVFYPNKSRQEQSQLPGPDGVNDKEVKNDNLILDEEIIESAKALLVKRQETKEFTALTARLKQIEKSLLLMNQQQNLIIEKISDLSK